MRLVLLQKPNWPHRNWTRIPEGFYRNQIDPTTETGLIPKTETRLFQILKSDQVGPTTENKLAPLLKQD